MTHEWSFNYSSNAQRFEPVVIHQAPDGAIRLPGNIHAPVPKGFQRVELTNLHEVRKFESKMNQIENAKAREARDNKHRALDMQRDTNRAAMDQIIQGCTMDGIKFPGFSQRGRKFHDAMRYAADVKRAERDRAAIPDSNFHVEAFSQDSSNREAHRDPTNNWGRDGQRRK